MTTAAPSAPCYALRVRTRSEGIVSTILHNKGYPVFAPTYSVIKQWSDRKVRIELPLLPGYIFCRFDVGNRLPILITEGVISIVGCGKIPVPVNEQEIQDLESASRSGMALRPRPYLREGRTVRLTDGPLAGITGVVVGNKGERRLVISVTLLQRSVTVEIDAEWASPLTENATS